MLSEEKLTELFRYSFSLIDSRMTPNQQAFCRAIESAATTPLLARIAELEAANEAFGKRQEWWNSRMLELERENAELVKALAEARKVLKETGLLLHHFWCDVQMNDYSFDKLNKGIEAIDAATKEQT